MITVRLISAYFTFSTQVQLIEAIETICLLLEELLEAAALS